MSTSRLHDSDQDGDEGDHYYGGLNPDPMRQMMHMKPQRGLNKKSGFTTSTFAQRRGPNAPK